LAIFCQKAAGCIIRPVKAQNAAQGIVMRESGIVVWLINTGDFAIFRQIGRPAAKTAHSRRNGRLLTWTFWLFV
jgi:hypothetical protein